MMLRARPLIYSAVLLASLTSWSLDAQEAAGPPVQEWIDLTGELIRQGVPQVMNGDLTLFEQADWDQLGMDIHDALHGVSWQEAAALLPRAELALEFLRQSEWTTPMADWLEPRLDYLEMAQRLLDRARVIRPLPPRQPTPPSRQPPSRPTPPPRTRMPEIRLVPEVERWQQSLRNRSAPRNARQLVPQLKKAFEQEGVPAELVWLAEVESSFNPQARSPVGAAGLFQFMPATAKEYGLEVSRERDDRLEPGKSAHASAKYLKKLYGRFQSWPLALASYNAGEGRVAGLLARTGGSDFDSIAQSLPIETRMYVPKVLATIALREDISPHALPPPEA